MEDTKQIEPLTLEPPPNLLGFLKFWGAAINAASTAQKMVFGLYVGVVIVQALTGPDWMDLLTNVIVLLFWGIAMLHSYIIDLYKKENDLLREYLNKMNGVLNRFFAGVEGKN